MENTSNLSTPTIGKTCKKCGAYKTLDCFIKNKSCADGTESTCKECKYIYIAQWKEQKRRNAGVPERNWRTGQTEYKCTKCGQLKPVEDFLAVSYRDGTIKSWCRECETGYKRTRREAQGIKPRGWRKQSDGRICPQCDTKKPYQDFNKSASECRQCTANRAKRDAHKKKANCHAYRARKRQSGGKYTAQQFLDLCAKYGNKCLCCGTSNQPLTVDHVIPLSKEGSSNIDNIQPLCKPCNSTKLNKTVDYRPHSLI